MCLRNYSLVVFILSWICCIFAPKKYEISEGKDERRGILGGVE